MHVATTRQNRKNGRFFLEGIIYKSIIQKVTKNVSKKETRLFVQLELSLTPIEFVNNGGRDRNFMEASLKGSF